VQVIAFLNARRLEYPKWGARLYSGIRLSGDDRVSQRISSGATIHIPLRYPINVSSSEKPMPN
ncbi:MAG TPA: hypothetical protein PLP59_12740, partial [Thermotogota bacterium]|nr:hypothetical protein [Thermotogota bacterium]